MKNAVLILFLFVNVAFGQKNNSIEKGFALVQSRQETTEFNALKGKKVIPVSFNTTKPLYPIKKHGQSRAVNSNAVYIQDNTSLRVFVFTNGIPKNFDLKTFIPSTLATNKPISQVKEEKDIVFEVDFEKKEFSTLRSQRSSNTLLSYYARTIGGMQLIEFQQQIYNNADEKFKYQPCREPYDILQIKSGSVSIPNNTNQNNRTVQIQRQAKVYPFIDSLQQKLSNSYLKNLRLSDAATDFHILNSNSSLVIDSFGQLDLEKSDMDPTEGNEECNKVGYLYKGKYYQLNFRYVRRNDSTYSCHSGSSCAEAFRQNLILPQNSTDFNLRTNPDSTLPQIVHLIIILTPDEDDPVGKPKPE